ncbi:MAG: nucleoside triphosphate pyrophosphohydrolase [Christensenellales bacterium]
MKELLIVGLGPSGPEHLTLNAAETLMGQCARVLRTSRHGVADWLERNGLDYESLDDLYENSGDFDAFADAAAERLIERAGTGPAAYCVPGAGDMLDAVVCRLAARAKEAGIALKFIPGVGAAADVCGKAAQAGCVQETGGFVTLCASSIDDARINIRQALIVLELDNALCASQVKLKLSDYYPGGHQIYFVTGESVRKIPLYELDRQKELDHTSAVFVPPVAGYHLEQFGFDELVEIIAILRGPGGCPWDREQTHLSIKHNFLEEVYEAMEAIELDDADKMVEELGDVMLQVVFHANIGREHGRFDIREVITAECRKMIQRHPHIFGDVRVSGSGEVLKNWEEIKKQVKGQKTQAEVLEDVPHNLPALMRAQKLQQKAAQVGFDWPDASGAMDKLLEEIEEVKAAVAQRNGALIEDELGDLLFAAVNVARLLGFQGEEALGRSSEKFISRFSAMERMMTDEGLNLPDTPLDEMDKYWERAKKMNNLEKKHQS